MVLQVIALQHRVALLPVVIPARFATVTVRALQCVITVLAVGAEMAVLVLKSTTVSGVIINLNVSGGEMPPDVLYLDGVDSSGG